MKALKARLGIFFITANRFKIKELALTLAFKREAELQMILHWFSSWFL